MSSPQLPRSHSLNSGVHPLIAPFSSLSIDSQREEEIVQAGAVKIPKEGEFFLNDEVYMSAAQVVRKEATYIL